MPVKKNSLQSKTTFKYDIEKYEQDSWGKKKVEQLHLFSLVTGWGEISICKDPLCGMKQ